jgi:hypothetical protein
MNSFKIIFILFGGFVIWAFWKGTDLEPRSFQKSEQERLETAKEVARFMAQDSRFQAAYAPVDSTPQTYSDRNLEPRFVMDRHLTEWLETTHSERQANDFLARMAPDTEDQQRLAHFILISKFISKG